MENIALHCYNIYYNAVNDYHVFDDVNTVINNPHPQNSLEAIFYKKNWIDTIQWHLEDIIRDPDIASEYGLSIKRRIDELNQMRTDTVEHIDDFFLRKYSSVIPQIKARHNTESLGWAFDRLSILAIREYHLEIELTRNDASPGHVNDCLLKKTILLQQKSDLLQSINWLIEDIEKGRKVCKIYKQLKMYNDSSFNPVLYKKIVERR